ncbi:MAG TPA: alpha/beta fold hydrolase, partial [Gemmatimonadales bacterium]|nr:alpha/beta fold hydrolase [Gemmatimonadales bacterium]
AALAAASVAAASVAAACVAALPLAGCRERQVEREAPPVVEGSLVGADGVQLFYRVTGQGDTIVVLHGGPAMSMSYLAADLAPLAERRTLIFYDQRGSGRSQVVSDPNLLTADRHVTDLEVLRAHFGIDRLTLLGHSWGVALAGLYTLEHRGRVGRLILVSGFGPRLAPHVETFTRRVASSIDSAGRARAARLDSLLPVADDPAAVCREAFRINFAGYFADRAELDSLRGDPCDIPAEALRRSRAVSEYTLSSVGLYDWRERLRGLQVPLLVIHGERDPVPVESAREWAEVAPDARIVVIPGAGHFPFAEEREAFVGAVEEFLATPAPPRR